MPLTLLGLKEGDIVSSGACGLPAV